jgi:predicted O-methyltransferase YrrM
MDHAVETVLAEYEELEMFATLGWQEVRQRTDESMSIGPEAGLFLNTLIKQACARRILELGTSYGYSTVFLAEAAQAIGGQVISCDISAPKQSYARTMLERAGLVSQVDFRLGDARATITELDMSIDFVLLDLRTHAYTMFDLFYPKLAAGAFIAADNITIPSSAKTEEYRRHVRTKPDIDSILIPIGQGVELSRFRGDCADQVNTAK